MTGSPTARRPRAARAGRRARLRLLLVAVGLIALAGCNGGGSSGPTVATQAGSTATQARGAAIPTRGAAIPARGAATAASAPSASPTPEAGFQHVFVVVMENQGYSAVIGNPDAPYLNQLAARYGLATSYYAVAHPSLPNYLALLSGQTFGLQDDCENCFQKAPTLADQLQASGRSWKAYMEDLPAPCSLIEETGNYALKHDPFLYFQSIRGDQRQCRQVVPLTMLTEDLAAGSLPTFAWISPNLVHDGHDSDLATADAWLRDFVPRILASVAWQQKGLLLITFDEGENDAGCCGAPGGGRVATLAIAPGMLAGARTARPADHYGLLRALEDAWRLPPLGHAATADGRWLLDLIGS